MGSSNIWGGVLVSVLLRWSVGLHGYSGAGKPPMFGDYEAQRHWMEVTVHLPPSQWYSEGPSNPLQYWGLDYPPLTGYHSWLAGQAAVRLNASWVALNTSRGLESPQHKLFMRTTVLISDLVTYLPAVAAYSSLHPNNRPSTPILPEVFIFLVYPGLILIDHGHFQYNCVSLGLALFSYLALATGHDLIASVLFCLSISYKQMLLYFSLPFFFFFLGRCHKIKKNSFIKALRKLFLITSVVTLTFILTWLPVAHTIPQLAQVLHRVFPLARGIFEDKVSNLWCLINVFFKFRNYVNNSNMATLSGVITLITTIPSCLHLASDPTPLRFTYSLVNSSLAFFLFSYQVHEKTILIPALAVMLIFKNDPFHSYWFLLVSTFSMFPLLQKDNLVIPFVSLSIIFVLSVNLLENFKDLDLFYKSRFLRYIPLLHKASFLVWIPLFAGSIFIKPPVKYPDLFPLLISCFSSVHFLYFCLYFNYVQLFRLNNKKNS